MRLISLLSLISQRGIFSHVQEVRRNRLLSLISRAVMVRGPRLSVGRVIFSDSEISELCEKRWAA